MQGPDPAWRGLYRAGAWSSLAFIVLVLVPVALVYLAPLPPSSGAEVLRHIQEHRVVYLVELVCFVGLAIPAMVVFTAWAAALWNADRSLALLGGVFGVGSEIAALGFGASPQSLHGGLVLLSDAYRDASTAQERAGLASAADALVATANATSWIGVLTAAAILVLSLAGRRAPIPRWLVLLGITTGVLGLLSEALRSTVGSAYVVYGLLLPTWFGVVGWQLRRLARDARG